ncbi:uncharacterized protein LOC126790711 isoform X2 [Argentina anserina]|uniref:uncharacterized protein LOC126790711 isoform X1 n=1 Tax=Argentina anserina TaxID=57926 RepID=UPI002176302F|nr:uncharacterized protein LOC126790711 isoform X1 [Potentilla anserina]XP_050373022.1 uncharacterized protein LOC126790711 isoform X2 [Potentilla anserina]
MTVATAATTQTKKLMKLGLSLFRRGFNSSKCKTAAKMAVARIKLLRNKRQVVVKQMRRDIASLLQKGEDATARIRVEHVIREQNVLSANEFIELFCELIVSRLQIIAKQRDCPADLKEGIASLIFATPRCSEIPELVALRNIFEKKYGRDFVAAATDLRPDCGVNRILIDKLSVRTPTGEVKLKIMKEIAKEYQVDWDTTECEQELLKPPEETIDGPRNFVSATSLPITTRSFESNKSETRHSSSSLRRTSGGGERENSSVRRMSGGADRETSSFHRTSGGGEREYLQFADSAAAAAAAAKSASDAMAAAQVAAFLANKDRASANEFKTLSGNSTGEKEQDSPAVDSYDADHQHEAERKTHWSESLDKPFSSNNDVSHGGEANNFLYRRYSYNAPSENSGIKFDESDTDEEIELEAPPSGNHQAPKRTPPPVPSAAVRQDSLHRVHPKLPDYDTLAARFDALKHHHK